MLQSLEEEFFVKTLSSMKQPPSHGSLNQSNQENMCQQE